MLRSCFYPGLILGLLGLIATQGASAAGRSVGEKSKKARYDCTQSTTACELRSELGFQFPGSASGCPQPMIARLISERVLVFSLLFTTGSGWTNDGLSPFLRETASCIDQSRLSGPVLCPTGYASLGSKCWESCVVGVPAFGPDGSPACASSSLAPQEASIVPWREEELHYDRRLVKLHSSRHTVPFDFL